MAGPTGPTGPTGPAGADSTVAGPTGSQGPIGNTGPAGADSTVAGPQGPTGASGSGSGDMLAASNLSDLASATTSRSNLDVDQAGTAVALAIALG